MTIQDLVDRCGDPGGERLLPTSPRSVEACLRLGIDPDTLAPRPLEYYLLRERNPDLAQLAFEHEERQRQASS